jgi:hypothetical protein
MLKSRESTSWKLAAEKEYARLELKGTFKHLPSSPPDIQNLLPLMWVFTYKSDVDGYLLSFKARLVVRGDLQVTMAETAATTLAARCFRSLIAIIAAFGLIMRQYDLINAFINADVNEKIYVQHPAGFIKLGILMLLKALYGLKQSPLLW